MRNDIVTVSSKYQVVIPQSLRAGISRGAKMMMTSVGGVIRLLPVQPAEAYRGIARGIDTTIADDPDRL